MLGKIKKITLRMLAGANTATIIFMLIVGYSYKLNPEEHPVFANIGLAFPVFLCINLAFLVTFLLFKRRLALIPIIGFIACYQPARTYSPLNVWQPVPDEAVKVMSFNVFNFRNIENDSSSVADIARYVAQCRPDIVCMQEANFTDEVKEAFAPLFPHIDSIWNNSTGEVQLTMSKFPILSKTHICTSQGGCLCGAYELLVGDSRVTVVNCHFETSGLTPEERHDFSRMIKGNMPGDTIGTESKKMIVSLGESAKRRVPQVSEVVRYIKSRKDEPVILCGDFNDNPISYCHYLLDKELTDCFKSTANGPGISYHRNTFWVRIDNIMCSRHWTPSNFEVDRSIAISDHYPILGYLKAK